MNDDIGEVESPKPSSVIVDVMDNWRVVRLDGDNWQIQNYRMPIRVRGNKEPEADWFGEGYFPTLTSALSRLLERSVGSKKDRYTLEEIAAEVKETKAIIAKAMLFN